MTTATSLYEPDGDRFVSTPWTIGPWDPGAQHGGPPSALITTVLAARHPRPDLALARLTVELLRPVPVAALQLATREVRGARRIDHHQAVLTADGVEVALASAWRIAPSAGDDSPPPPAAVPGVDADAADAGFPPHLDPSYFTALEWRYVRGSFGDAGPAAVWTRLHVTVLPDEEPLPEARVMVIADSGNGVSHVLDFRKDLFINPELTVHFTRPAEGEWICLDAHTTILGGGPGLAQSVISDERGPIARGHQSLLIERNVR